MFAPPHSWDCLYTPDSCLFSVVVNVMAKQRCPLAELNTDKMDCVCVCVCVRACVRACVCVCAGGRSRLQARSCVYVCMCARVQAFEHFALMRMRV